MEVNLINKTEIAKPKDSFASLEKIKEDAYEYNFCYQVSKAAINSVDANRIVLRTYRTDPKSKVSISIFNGSPTQTLNLLNLNASSIIDSISKRNFDILNSINETRKNFLTTHSENLNDLVNFYNNGVGYSAIIPNKTEDSFRNFLYESNISEPDEPLPNNRTLQQLNNELLFKENIDPAEILQQIYTTNTVYEVSNGTAPNFFPQNLDTIKSLILSNLITSNETNLQPTIQSFNIKDRDVIDIYFTAQLSKEIIGTEDFYVMTSVYNLSNDLVQEFVTFVSHKNNLGFFTFPKVPPIISVRQSSDGNLLVFLQQLDPNATGVKLYQINYNATGDSSTAIQQFVGSYELNPGESTNITLQKNFYGKILFRAIPFDTNGKNSFDFSGAIIETLPTDSNLIPNTENSFINLKSEYVQNGLNITISDFTSEIGLVHIYKSDITEDPYAEESILTTINIGGNNYIATYGFLDTDVQPYRNYRYTCKLVDIKGKEFDSSANLEVYYRPVEQSYVSVTTTSPIVTPIQLPRENVQYFDVAFNISYAITPKLEDYVKQLLISQGLIEYYGDDINKNRLRELVMTKVELRDLNTNDVYFLGFVNNTFNQGTTNFGLLSKASKYVYILTTYIRNPQTLLENNTAIKLSTPRTNSKISPPSYSFSPYNLNNPYGLLTGTNPKKSGDEFVKQYGLDQFALGSVGSIVELPINLNPPIPVVNTVRAFILNNKKIKITWSVNGSQDEISHFIIRRQNMQTNSIDLLGKAHGINVQNSYYFITDVRYTETGIFKYIITMQYTDMSLSSDYISNEVVI